MDIPPRVEVIWRDAYFEFDGTTEVRNDYLVRTIGFLVSEGPLFLVVAQELLPDNDGYRAKTFIPNAIVESVAPLQPGSRRRPAASEPAPRTSAG